MMAFEKWSQTYQVAETIGREAKSYLKWTWDVATEKERGRCARYLEARADECSQTRAGVAKAASYRIDAAAVRRGEDDH